MMGKVSYKMVVLEAWSIPSDKIIEFINYSDPNPNIHFIVVCVDAII